MPSRVARRGYRAAMPRVGLVLGAGGVVGQAYHAGVLASLEHDLGWDPRTADVIVGTSAGSVTGTLLRMGVSASDLAAWAVEAPLSIEGAELLEPFGREEPEFPAMRVTSMMRPPRMPGRRLVMRAARRPWAFRPSVAAATLLPPGQFDIAEVAGKLTEVAGTTIPPGLFICAARRSDGHRVVFGRPGAPRAALARAVAASCSIPGFFAPVSIGGIQYIDGGVHSPTNADVLRDQDLDVVIVVSSMSAAAGRAATPDAPMRWWAHRRLEREAQRLASRGTRVVTFEPRRRSLAAMGVNAMAMDRGDATLQAAFVEAGRRSARAREARILAALGERATHRYERLSHPA